MPVRASGTAAAPTRFVADGKVVVAQGFVVDAEYTDFTGFEVAPGASTSVYSGNVDNDQYIGQVRIRGSHDSFDGFNVHDCSYGAAFSMDSGASHDVIKNFTITDCALCGIITTSSWNTGADDNLISHGTITDWGGMAAVDLWGDRNVCEYVTLEGPGGEYYQGDPHPQGGEGVRVNYSTDSIIRSCTMAHLWTKYDNTYQHVDVVQAWTHVHNLLIDSCLLGTWEPGGFDDKQGPRDLIGIWTIPSNDHVDLTVRNCVLLGDCTIPGASIGLSKGSGATAGIRCYNNTFWCRQPDLGGFETVEFYNNAVRQMYAYGWRTSSSDHNAYFWLPTQDDNMIPVKEGSHSLGRTYATRLSAADCFVNPDISAATDYGVSADWHLKPGSPLIGAGYAPISRDIGAYQVTPVSKKPHIAKLSPRSGRRGTIVTIIGQGFGSRRGASFVKFGAAKCRTYLSWRASRIRCRVPQTAAFGRRRVRVTTAGSTSHAAVFTIKR